MFMLRLQLLFNMAKGKGSIEDEKRTIIIKMPMRENQLIFSPVDSCTHPSFLRREI